MGLDISKNPFLYSVGTELAYKIAKRYYNNIHYVWCTTEFNSLKQPPTSNPATICKRYLEQITTGDRHTKEIENNMAGILRGAKAKFDSGVIDKIVYNKIRNYVSGADYEAFFPVLYIVESRKIRDRYIEVIKTLKTVKKQESIILKEKIRAFQTIARARGMGEIARANIDEIAKTQEFIDRLQMDGAALDYAMTYMERLSDMLNINLILRNAIIRS